MKLHIGVHALFVADSPFLWFIFSSIHLHWFVFGLVFSLVLWFGVCTSRRNSSWRTPPHRASIGSALHRTVCTSTCVSAKPKRRQIVCVCVYVRSEQVWQIASRSSVRIWIILCDNKYMSLAEDDSESWRGSGRKRGGVHMYCYNASQSKTACWIPDDIVFRASFLRKSRRTSRLSFVLMPSIAIRMPPLSANTSHSWCYHGMHTESRPIWNVTIFLSTHTVYVTQTGCRSG